MTYRILIVDDEPEILSHLSDVLRPYSIETETACSYSEALVALVKNRYNAILSDIQMPVKGGLDLLAHLNEKNIYIPFVFLTGFADKQALLKAMELRAFALIEKPFDFGHLKKTLLEAIQSEEVREIERIELLKKAR